MVQPNRKQALLQEAEECVRQAQIIAEESIALCREALIPVPVIPPNSVAYTWADVEACSIISGDQQWLEMITQIRKLQLRLKVEDVGCGPANLTGLPSASGENPAPSLQPLSELSREKVSEETNSSVHNFRDPPAAFVEAVESSSAMSTSSAPQTSFSTLEYVRARASAPPPARKRLNTLPPLKLEGLGQSLWLSGGQTQGESYNS